MTFRWKIAQAAEIRWWQNYLKNKSTTEYADWKTQYWENLLEETGLTFLNESDKENPNKVENLRILDAGCGPAGIFMIFKNLNNSF